MCKNKVCRQTQYIYSPASSDSFIESVNAYRQKKIPEVINQIPIVSNRSIIINKITLKLENSNSKWPHLVSVKAYRSKKTEVINQIPIVSNQLLYIHKN